MSVARLGKVTRYQLPKITALTVTTYLFIVTKKRSDTETLLFEATLKAEDNEKTAVNEEYV